jgi:hypothetical protein
MISAIFWDITQRHVAICYHSTPRNIPEERRSHHHRGGSLKSIPVFIIAFNKRFLLENMHSQFNLFNTPLCSALF